MSFEDPTEVGTECLCPHLLALASERETAKSPRVPRGLGCCLLPPEVWGRVPRIWLSDEFPADVAGPWIVVFKKLWRRKQEDIANAPWPTSEATVPCARATYELGS